MGITRLSICFIVSFVFGLAFNGHAQEKSFKKTSVTQVIDGVKYYVHIVEKGQTLYAISKVYEVTTNDIVLENPSVSTDGLKVGMMLKIPFKQKETTSIKIPPGNYQKHVVEKGETLYSLSKKFSITTDQLLVINPEIKEGGLRSGMEIRIPGPGLPVSENVVPDTVVSPAPVFPVDSVISIAYFIPFFTEMNDEDKEYKNIYGKETIYPKSEIGVGFYEGVLLALDSLKNAGVKAKIYVFDTSNDSLIIDDVLKRPELKQVQLIVGPFYSATFNIVADFAKLNHITVVTPFSQINKILLGNAYINKITPGLNTQVDELGKYLTEKHDSDNVLLVHNEIPRERIYTSIIRRNLATRPRKDTINEVSYKKGGIDSVKKKLIKNRRNVIVVPSNDQAFVTDLINNLYLERGDYDIVLYGLESWSNFDNLDYRYLNELKLHLPASSYVNYENDTVKKFVSKFRDRYKAEPDRFAFHGYDITMFYGEILKKLGKNMTEYLEDFKVEGLQTGFDFYQTAVESGFENRKTYIVKYENYKLIKIDR